MTWLTILPHKTAQMKNSSDVRQKLMVEASVSKGKKAFISSATENSFL